MKLSTFFMREKVTSEVQTVTLNIEPKESRKKQGEQLLTIIIASWLFSVAGSGYDNRYRSSLRC